MFSENIKVFSEDIMKYFNQLLNSSYIVNAFVSRHLTNWCYTVIIFFFWLLCAYCCCIYICLQFLVLSPKETINLFNLLFQKIILTAKVLLLTTIHIWEV